MDGQRIDTEVMVQGGMDLAEMDGSVGDFRRVAIGRTDHLARSKAPAGDQTVTHFGPVIPSRVRIDSRRTAKFSPGNDRDIFVETSFVQVSNQRMHSLFKQGKVSVLALAEIAGIKFQRPKFSVTTRAPASTSRRDMRNCSRFRGAPSP